VFGAPDPRCPSCSGRIDAKPLSFSNLFGTAIVSEVTTWALAGLFGLAGLVWEPAWAIAFVIVIFAILRRSERQAHYVCMRCDREYTRKELYGSKP
jgi:DNA-directed RNA polymerase subunit RPC12/RpoP